MKTLTQAIFLWLISHLVLTGGETSGLNLWPFWVEGKRSGLPEWQSVGPLAFGRDMPDGPRASGFRPLWVEFKNQETASRDFHFLYPLYTVREDKLGREVSMLNIVRNYTFHGETRYRRDFDVFPLIWYRNDPDPELSYFGIGILGGTIKNRLGADRIDWVLFPFYNRYEKDGEVVVSHPWPFFRTQSGAGSGGYSLWPLYSHRYREGHYDRKYALWPLMYHKVEDMDNPVPSIKKGFLPFYSMTENARSRSRHSPWPFSGYVQRLDIDYREDHYIWPIWLQVRGENAFEDRFIPFYSHSRYGTEEKRWYAWPLIRNRTWQAGDLELQRTQILFFLFWNESQRRKGDSDSPVARKTHLWPILSGWDNGAGREQVQIFSPFEVFFQRNEVVRELYTPLFALYRKDIDRNENRIRHDFLFNLITWERDGDDQRFDFGPLVQQRSSRQESSFKLLHGLLGWSGEKDESHLHFLWFRL